MDHRWLVKLFEEVGLTAEQAGRAAEETRRRLLRRERPRIHEGAVRRSITDFLVRDPLTSLNRIIGRGDSGLPFFDDETKQLSAIAFSSLLKDIGMDAVVSIAYAKVVVEAFEPKDLYTPIWEALGKKGPLDLEELRRMDWSPLRADVAPADNRDTVVARVNPTDDTVVTPTTPTSGPPANRAPVTRRSPANRPTPGRSKIIKPKK